MTCDECGEPMSEAHAVECCGPTCRKWLCQRCAYRNGDSADAMTYCGDCYAEARYLARYGSKAEADAAMAVDYRAHMAAARGYQTARLVVLVILCTLAMW